MDIIDEEQVLMFFGSRHKWRLRALNNPAQLGYSKPSYI